MTEVTVNGKIFQVLISRKELEEAGAALSASAYIPAASDFIYGGDIAKWKKVSRSMDSSVNKKADSL